MRYALSQPARFNLPRKDPLVGSLCMALIAMCRRTARLWGAIAESRPVRILVHYGTEPPMQSVLHTQCWRATSFELFGGSVDSALLSR